MSENDSKNKSFRNFLTAPIVHFIVLSTFGVITWQIQGDISMLISFLYIAIFTSVGMTLYAVLPEKKKSLGRRISFFMVGGLSCLVGMGILGRINGQIEGFWFYVLAGVSTGAVIHYLGAKIIGPVLLHRSWCAWGCWTMMLLDLLPYKKSSGQLHGRWGWLRVIHFTVSIGLVLALWYGFGYSISRCKDDIRGLYWFLAGNGFYYISGIGLAFLLEDNRAFCKCLCPATVFLKVSSAFSLLKIKGKTELCNECGMCEETCPMDVKIPNYVKSGQRVLSTECVLCMKCISACPTGALRVSLGFDSRCR